MGQLSTTKTWRKTFIDVVLNEGPPAQSGQSDGDRQNRQLLWEIKEALITGTGAWTVVRSAGYQDGDWDVGNADYWTTANDVRWKDTDGTYSWIVLEQTGIHDYCRILIRLFHDKLETESICIYVSCDDGAWGAGGSSTTIPDFPTQYRAVGYANIWQPWIDDGEHEKVANVFQSSDGECTRIYIHDANLTGEYRFFMIDKPMANTALDETIWPVPVVTCGVQYLLYDAAPQYESYIGGLLRCETSTHWLGGQKCGVYTAAEGAVPAALISNVYEYSQYLAEETYIAPDYDGKYMCFPLDLATNRAGSAGVFCRVQDLWLAPTSMADGDMFPNDGSKQFVKIGCVIQPNDGTSLVLSN